MQLPFVLISACVFAGLSVQDSTFTPARPPAIPLAVKSPYLNSWLYAGSDGGNGGYLAGQWPQFWQNQILGWAGMIRVDGESYTWMGNVQEAPIAEQVAFEYTATQSKFTFQVNNQVELDITFLSPITPDDMMRQSLIFSYLDVAVSSLDQASHTVEVYTDISAEWISGDRSSIANWKYGEYDDIIYHKVYKADQEECTENDQQAEWGNWYYSTANSPSVSYQAGEDTVVRGQFTSSGTLQDSVDEDFRAISDDWPVFAYAVDFGTIDGSTSGSSLFTLGVAQYNATQFTGAEGTVNVTSMWTSYFSDELDMVSFFYDDYSTATSTASAFDSQVSSDSTAAAGADYYTITALAARQAFGAVQLCGDIDKPYLFLKEISSDGDIQTVDVIFPFHPILLYTNPTLLKYALDPLFENQESGDYPNQWAMHDLGYYPNAWGHPDGNDEQQPLEECGNMLIMTLAYAQAVGDVDYLAQHYEILNQWTGFLVDEALVPDNQISTDDFAGSLANQTNLALKGIIGIQAMSVIANLTGNTADAENYSSIASDYITQWQAFAIDYDATPPHTTLSYGNDSSHGLLYNLYADRLLNLDLVPQSVYDMQSDFYPTVALTYGVPLDTRHTYTKSDWEMFCAAIAAADTQAMFVRDLATWINETPTSLAETDIFDADTGDFDGIYFTARPVVGGHFALLALP